MSSLTLRHYTSYFVIAGAMLSLIIGFQGAIFNEFGLQESSQLEKIQEQVDSQQPSVAEGQNRTGSINIESGNFFLSSVYNIVRTVVDSLGAAPVIGEIIVADFGWPHAIGSLFVIPTIYIIWEIVSIYRGIRT